MQRNKIWKGMVFIAAVGLLCVPSIFADDAKLEEKIDRLEKRVESQELQLQKFQSKPISKQTNSASDTTVGGYGEISYNSYHEDNSRNQMDLRRFVISVGHRFNDRWTFNGEVEWEHAVTSEDDQGETAIEQAFLNYQFAPGVNLKTGLFLMPFGFLNQAHEPPVYHGVERNEVETRIIPSTWREGGVGFEGTTSFGLATEIGVVTGFDVTKFDDPSEPLASVHQELQFARASDLSYYGALNYIGVPGVTVGGALFTGNSTHNNAAFKEDNTLPDFSDIDGHVTLWESHARFQKRGLDLQALYAEGKIGEAGKINQMLDTYNIANPSNNPRSFVPEMFSGWLLQTAYTIWQRGDMSLTPFVRYEKFNTQAQMSPGFAADPANADRVATFGLTLKPVQQVVFKTDYQRYRDNRINDRFNIGMGYMF